MLVLTRKVGEAIVIGGNIVITPTRMVGDRVRLTIEAPRDVLILRGELRRCDDCGEAMIDCRCVSPDASGERNGAHL